LGNLDDGALSFFISELGAYGVADEFFAADVAEVAVVFDEGFGFVEEFWWEVHAGGEEVFDYVCVGLHFHGLGGYFA